MSLENIDILITTRNRIEELAFTINHCISIGLRQDQIWITDDASTDGTSERIEEKYPKVYLIKNNESKGLIHNRNVMMQATSKPYILSLDDDSHIRTLEDILEAIAVLESHPDYGIFHFHAFEQLAEPPAKEDLPNTFREIRTYIGCGHMIKREVIQILGKYREEFEFYCEELDYSIRAYNAGYKVVTKDNLVVHHRVDMSSRKKQLNNRQEKGIYGLSYRWKLLLRNNLYVTHLHYPFPFNLLFNLKYILKRLSQGLSIKYNTIIVIGALRSYFENKKFLSPNRRSISYNQFFKWILKDLM